MTNPNPPHPQKAPNRRGSRRRWLARGAGLLVALGVVAGVVFAVAPRPVPVDVVEAANGPLAITVQDDGKTRLRDRTIVSTPVAGRVSRVTLRPGDEIREGQIITHVVPQLPALVDERSLAEAEARAQATTASVGQARANIDRAKTALELAKTDAARARELHAAGAIPKSELDRQVAEERLRAADLSAAEFGLLVARNEDNLAKIVLGKGRPAKGAKPEPGASIDIPSPIRGVVLRVHQESDAVLGPGAPLVELGDPGSMEVVVDVLTADAVRIKPGQAATISGWGGADLHAHVRRVEPAAMTKLSSLGVEEQRVNVLLDLQDPRERWLALGDGFRVEASIVVDQHDDALLVPIGALFARDGARRVFVVGADGRASERTVSVAAQGLTQAVIAEGLAAGDRVVLHPSDRIQPGVRVAPRAQP